MTQSKTSADESGTDPATTPNDVASEPAPPAPPEPMTPAKVFEWNSYYDVYVAAGVLLLAFLTSANRLPGDNSVVWSYLHAGRQMTESGRPLVQNVTSIVNDGQRWVNISWLMEWAYYQVFANIARVAPGDPTPDLLTRVDRGAQAGIGVLIALTALIRAGTALLLLQLRRKGPGLWWTSVCTAMAIGVFFVPIGIPQAPAVEGGEITLRTVAAIQLGGLAQPAQVGPVSWGVLLLALELFLIHRATVGGRPRAFLGLIPVFLAWANLDASFGFGLLVLMASVVGIVLQNRRIPSASALTRTGWIAIGGSLVATLISPSHVYGWIAGFEPFLSWLGIDLGPQAPSIFNRIIGARTTQLYFALLIGVGFASFILNRRRFSLVWFLAYVVAVVAWGASLGYLPFFAVMLAAVLAINGQDWFLDTFGVEGQLGNGWRIWSTGGRLVTIALIFAAVTQSLTGWGGQLGDSVYGFGFNPEDFPFEVAQTLKDAPIQGGILNTTLAQGDVLAWRVAPQRRGFIDSRLHLYRNADFLAWEKLRLAIRDDDVATWKPILDQGKVSTILVRAAAAPRTYIKLMNSSNWIPFYDDGSVQMFGRSDPGISAVDLAYFQTNRLSPENLAYKKPREVPPLQRTPTETTKLDEYFRNRTNRITQPHVEAAARWLSPVSIEPGRPFLPDPARCLLAIRESRIALTVNPDDPAAFQRMIEAYQLLMQQESALLVGIPITTEDIPRIIRATPQTRLLATRARQLLAAMNYAIQTLPPSLTATDRKIRTGLNMSLAQTYIQAGILDLARDRLVAIDLSHPAEFSNEEFSTINQQLNQLNQRLNQTRAQMDEFVIQQRPTPLQKAEFAQSQGAYGMAIQELEEADQSGGGNPAGIRPTLLDLYCEVGQPDKALMLLGSSNVDDPTLSTGIGTASFRQARVYFLLGNYASAVELMKGAINQLRNQRTVAASNTTQMILTGEPIAATKTLLDIPGQVTQQAQWEFELGLAALEGGLPPDVAGDHFTTALQFEPDFNVRPIMAYYLDRLGRSVPPPRVNSPPAIGPEKNPVAEPAPMPSPKSDQTPASTSELPMIEPAKPSTTPEPKVSPQPPL